MKKGKFIFGIILGLVLIFVVINFFMVKEITVYMGIANPSKNIDMLLKLDQDTIYNDTLEYNPFKYVVKRVRMKGVIHKLYIKSSNKNIEKETNLLVFFDQHLVVEFLPAGIDNKEEAIFFVRNRLTPFYLE